MVLAGIIMSKKIVLRLSTVLVLVISTYFAFHNSDEWTENNQKRIEVYNKDYPNLNANDRVMDLLEKAEYAAIVYPKANRVYPNSWFHNVILGNPSEGTSYTIRADVEFTIMGIEYSSITYGSAINSLPPHPLFVALCVSDEIGLFAPDNGYEIPATKEIVEFLKTLDRKKITQKNSSACLG